MKKISYITLCGFLLLSCEDDISIDIIREQPKIVLHAYFEKEKPMTLDLLRSIPIPNQVNYNRSFYHIDNAEVNVFVDDVLLGTMTHEGSGVYMLDQYPEENHHYRISVKAQGLPEVTTDVEVLPSPPKVNDYSYNKKGPLGNSQNPSVEHTLVIENNPGMTVFYKISLDIRVIHYKKGEIQREEIINWYRLASANPLLKDYTCLENCYGDTGNMKALYFSNEAFGDSPEITLLLTTDYFEDFEVAFPNETVKTVYVQSIQVSHISSSLMNYSRSIYDNSNANQLFQEPVSIMSNVNGGFGVFGTLNSIALPFDFSE
ncbi:DUF4249 family protein [Lunatimonas salinarum]|uniref:DUF4249 family protein n=1 Tax=Lunatimonas salinarum TaxID=1774590 RepID=UPI001ADFF98E|nr:DUF4249 family protein [Lunatimonas salinarum]